MNSLTNPLAQHATPRFATRVLDAASSVCGASAALLFAAANAASHCVGSSNSWIFFFLAFKPLIDLAWRWRFFEFSRQGVNLQALVGIAVLLLNGVALLHRAAWRTLPKRVLLMLAMASLSVCFSPSSWAFNELLRLFAGTAFFYTAGPLLAEPRNFDRFSKAFLWAMLLPVLLSYLQWMGVLPYEYWDWLNNQAIGRASGTYPTPLSMSFFLYFAFPIALSLASGESQSSWSKRGALAFLLLAAGAMALGNHRTGYIIVALQVFVWLLMTHGRKAVLGFLAALALVVLFSASWLQTLYAPVGTAISGEADFENGDVFRGRGFQWFLFLNSYASSGPFHWVIGNGGSTIAGYDPEDTDVDSVEPHNDYIRILHAYGAAGLLVYLSTLALFFRKSFQLLKCSAEFPRTLARIMLLALLAIVIQSTMMEPMRFPTGVWYLFAMGSALFYVKAASPGCDEALA